MTRNHFSKPALRMGWHHLLFLHWRADTEQLQKLLPPQLEIDTFDRQAFVGLIPFSMTRVRPRFLPGLPFAPKIYENFHETNVRTYVRHRETNERGVWFFSLDAANLPAVVAARMWFHLPYFWSKMNIDISRRGNQRHIEYSNRRVWPSPKGCGCQIRANVDLSQTPRLAEAGSLEHFFVERYLLFSHDGQYLYRGRVAHAPYRLRSAHIENCEEDLIDAANIEYSKCAPHVLYADDVRVEASRAEKLNEHRTLMPGAV